MYSWIAWARCCIDIDCSQTRPGPGSAARNRPEPPKNAFWMPGTVVLVNATDSRHSHRVAALRVDPADPPMHLDPGLPLPLQPLHAEARAAEDPGAQLLLEAD